MRNLKNPADFPLFKLFLVAFFAILFSVDLIAYIVYWNDLDFNILGKIFGILIHIILISLLLVYTYRLITTK